MAGSLVIGGGHVGKMLSLDLLENNVKTYLATLSQKSFLEITAVKKENITLRNELTGESETGDLSALEVVPLEDSRFQDAVENSDNIFICVPDIPGLRTRILSELTRKSLKGKRLVFIRGGQGWIPYLATLLGAEECLRECSVLMIEDSLYGCRFIGSNVSYKRKLSINAAILGRDELQTIKVIRELLAKSRQDDAWPNLVEVSPMGLMFDALGYIIHTGVILHGPNIEKTKKNITYNHYIEGVDEAHCHWLELLDKERVLLASKFGAIVSEFKDTLGRQYNVDVKKSLYATLMECRDVYKSRSPSSMQELKLSRAIHEDISALRVIDFLTSLFPSEFSETRKYLAWVESACRQERIDIAELDFYREKLREHVSTTSEFIDLIQAGKIGSSSRNKAQGAQSGSKVLEEA